MNRIYRLVFSTSLHTFVVTSELARGRCRGGSSGASRRPAGAAAAQRSTAACRRLGLLASLVAAQFLPGPALAHTTSIGYENSGLNALTFWYGTYHGTGELPYNEGSMRLTGPNGFDATLPYDLFSEAKPTGLVDGATNFYAGYGDGLMPSDVTGSPPQNWQGLRFTDLRPGTYTFTYVPIANPTSKWEPTNDAVLSNSVTVITADLDNVTDRISTGETVDQAGVSDPIIFDGGTLKLSEPATFAQVVSVNDPGGTIDTAGHAAIITGDMDGRGVLKKAGEGTLFLRGTNSSTGGLALAGGIVNIDSDSRLGAGTGALRFDGGTLQLADSFALGSGRGIQLDAGGGLVDTQAHATTIQQAITGPGGLGKTGSGTLTLGGVNTYTGITTIDSGTLALAGTGSIAASSGVVNNGILDISATDAGASVTGLTGTGEVVLGGKDLTLRQAAGRFDGTISGTGALVVAGGDQTLAGANTHSGGTRVRNATLHVSADHNLGAASGSLSLDNATLETDASFRTSRNIELASDSRISTADGSTLTAGGRFTGAGRLFKDGSGTLVLTGDNIGWTGGTTIDAGVLRVTSATGIGTGDVLLNGGSIETTVTLTTGQQIHVGGNTGVHTAAGTTTTLSGNIDAMGGTGGCFVKSGSGTLDLAGTATLGNGLCIEEGVLKVNGTLTGAAAVKAGGWLRGTGQVTGRVTVYGILAPGNSPGTLTSAGTVTMAAGSNFQVDINGLGTGSGPGNYSRLLVTGADSQFVIGEGVTLAPNLVAITGADTYTPYVPRLGDNFRVVTAEGGIVGRFAPLTQPQGLASGTRMTAFYDALGSNSVDLRVIPIAYRTALPSGANSNALSAASALDSLMSANDRGGASAVGSDLAYAVSGATTEQLPQLVASLAGEVHGALAAAAPMAGQALQQAVVQRLAETSTASGSQQARAAAEQALWVDLSGQRARWSADGRASSFRADGNQLTLGADLRRDAGRRFGVGVSHARTDVDAAGGSGAIRQNLLFAYGEHAAGPMKLDLLAGIGRSTWETERSDPLQGRATLRGNADGRESLVSVGLRAPWQLGGSSVEPFARLLWQRSQRDGLQETGSAAALQLREHAATGTRAVAGVSGGWQAADPLAARTTLRYTGALGYDSGSLLRPAVAASLGGVDMTIASPDVGRAFVQASLAGTWRTGPRTYLYYGLSGEFRDGRTDLGVSGGLRVQF